MDNVDSALQYALERLGRPSLSLIKPEQVSAIKSVLLGNDTFVWLPTGFGKSICFEALPFVYDYKLGNKDRDFRSLVLVISPLISLMVNQVLTLRTYGVSAGVVSHGKGVQKDVIASGEDTDRYSLLFCSPEAIVNSKWRELLQQPAIYDRIVAVVVDEAHCVSKWSKDFRPSYSRLHEIRALIPPLSPLLACTATVTKSIRDEVIKCLEMDGCEIISKSPDRPNIFYKVLRLTDMDSDLKPYLESMKQLRVKSPRIIIYCRSLNTCSELYAYFLYELGEKSYYPDGAEKISDNRIFGMFHAHTPEYNKEVILKSLSQEDGIVRIVFATVALGMGIDLKATNTIIHYGAPQSIDDYFQESGRGGRSGDPAESIVYWRPKDCPMRKELITLRDHEVASVRRYLENNAICRRKWLLDYFDPSIAFVGSNSKTCCDICAYTKNNISQ